MELTLVDKVELAASPRARSSHHPITPRRPGYLFAKRAFDIVVATIALVLLIPVFIVTAFLVAFCDGWPVLYWQTRIGKGGKPFRIYKFRTMYKDADEVLKRNPQLREQFEQNFKLDRDPRIIKTGHFMRKTSIDEFPQLWNVIIGNMSIVGPRPVLQREIDLFYKEDARYYLAVKPGCAGLWQCSGRNDTTYDERINLDRKYVKEANLWLDIQICFRTAVAMAFRRGAR